MPMATLKRHIVMTIVRYNYKISHNDSLIKMAQIDVTIYQQVLTKWKHHYLLKWYCKWLLLGSLYLLWLIDVVMDCCMDYCARRSCQCFDVWMLMWSIWPLQSMLWTRAKSVQQTKKLLQRCNVWHTHTHICHCRYIYIYICNDKFLY